MSYIKEFFVWLKALYYIPAATVETQSSGVTMTDQVVDVTQPTAADAVPATAVVATDISAQVAAPVADTSIVVETAVATAAAAVTTSALAEFKAKAEAEIAAFVAFVEHGIKVLGADAEAELVALKNKYI